MGLAILWFVLVAVLWTGFFVLEGFDFGVGMLHALVGRDEPERQLAIGSVGPLWDGNEVWLVVAAAAMFAAFPGWYATMFSAFYLPLVLLLASLIVRGVSFEYRGQRDSARWRRTWSVLLTAGSVVAPFVIGIALGDLVHGLPLNSQQEFTGSVADLFSAYSVFVGLTFVALCAAHGATFLALKTDGPVRRRAQGAGRVATPVAAVAVLVVVVWTQTLVPGSRVIPGVLPLLAILAAVAAVLLVRRGEEGWAFTATAVAIAGTVLTVFVELYPRVLVSSSGSASDLTVQNTATASYALTVITVVAVVFLPLVLLYQGWTYYVFRRRTGTPGTGATPVVPAPTPPPEGRPTAPVAGD